MTPPNHAWSFAAAIAASASVCLANEVDVAGGQTSVVLDTETLAAAASLELSGVSDAVIVPGTLEGSVAFPINARDAGDGLLPTTFSYDTGDFLGTFSGTIEHEGSVLFNDDTVEVGNFTIGFDPARAGTLGGNASGFFVASTVGIEAILFDVANPSGLSANLLGAQIEADLLVSPEFGAFLFDNGLSASDLAGADVGDALVEALTDCTGADINDNQFVAGRDLRLFLRALRAGNPEADLNGNGFSDRGDLALFLDTWIDCIGFVGFGFGDDDH